MRLCKVVLGLYQCELCGTHYMTPEQAQACEQSGIPALRFPRGSSVRLTPEAAPPSLRGETFAVDQAAVMPRRPERTECSNELGLNGHGVSYLLRSDIGRIGFIDEEHLAPMVEDADQ